MPERGHTTNSTLSAYIDGELPPDKAVAVSEHLATCLPCSTEYETMLETVGTLRAEMERFSAPDVLRARIRGAVASTPAGDGFSSSSKPGREGATRKLPWSHVGSWAAALLLAASLGGVGTFVVAGERGRNDTALASEVLASHVRSLMPDHLTDVRSNDQHNVKPWFNGRLDYSPNVPRLEDQGFPLIGGRLDYVDGRPVAVVVYARRQHVINVFSWPSSGPDLPRETSSKNGYTMIRWRSQGAEHWVLSDLNANELQSFARLQ
ncbi:MAG: anti-sigma factor family protein [Gemmatimonadaceae bacterium]